MRPPHERFRLGHVARAHADLIRLWRAQPSIGSAGTRRLTGVVVDQRGRPVAGASVAAAGLLIADSVAIGLPTFSSFDGYLTACAVGISDDLLDPESRRRFYAHLAELDVKREHIGPTTELVTLATPPQQRYD